MFYDHLNNLHIEITLENTTINLETIHGKIITLKLFVYAQNYKE